jgi:hypothetical protein
LVDVFWADAHDGATPAVAESVALAGCRIVSPSPS